MSTHPPLCENPPTPPNTQPPLCEYPPLREVATPCCGDSCASSSPASTSGVVVNRFSTDELYDSWNRKF